MIILRKRKMIINKRILILGFLVSILSIKGYTQLPDIDDVKGDLIANQDSILISEETIQSLRNPAFYYIEFNNYCLVHVSNNSWIYEPIYKSSAVVIYEKVNENWKLVNVSPFYSKLELLKEEDSLFVSDNFLCDLVGRCKSLISVLKFSNNRLVELTSYDGFSNAFYLENCIGDEKQKIDESINDTIAKGVTIKNIRYNSNGRLEYKLVIEKNILKGYSDTLNLQTVKSEELIIK